MGVDELVGGGCLRLRRRSELGDEDEGDGESVWPPQLERSLNAAATALVVAHPVTPPAGAVGIVRVALHMDVHLEACCSRPSRKVAFQDAVRGVGIRTQGLVARRVVRGTVEVLVPAVHQGAVVVHEPVERHEPVRARDVAVGHVAHADVTGWRRVHEGVTAVADDAAARSAGARRTGTATGSAGASRTTRSSGRSGSARARGSAASRATGTAGARRTGTATGTAGSSRTVTVADGAPLALAVVAKVDAAAIGAVQARGIAGGIRVTELTRHLLVRTACAVVDGLGVLIHAEVPVGTACRSFFARAVGGLLRLLQHLELLPLATGDRDDREREGAEQNDRSRSHWLLSPWPDPATIGLKRRHFGYFSSSAVVV